VRWDLQLNVNRGAVGTPREGLGAMLEGADESQLIKSRRTQVVYQPAHVSDGSPYVGTR
jgi:hypothetical protein